jgi:hypothetical protein
MTSARDNPGAPQQKQGWQKLIGKQSHVDIMRKFRDQLVAARKFRETCRVKEEISSLFGSLGCGRERLLGNMVVMRCDIAHCSLAQQLRP